VLTSPGIPLLFQGQEFLEDRWFHDQDPLEWTRAEKFEGLTCMYQTIIRLRRNLEGTTAGLRGQNTEVHHVNDVDKIIAYHRWDQGGPQDSVIVIANMANREHESYVVGFPRPGMWKLRFNSDWDGYDESFGNYLGTDIEAQEGETDGMAWFGNVRIGPYSVLIYSQDE
jgi:1,4-alpha-glucan branching enzyme